MSIELDIEKAEGLTSESALTSPTLTSDSCSCKTEHTSSAGACSNSQNAQRQSLLMRIVAWSKKQVLRLGSTPTPIQIRTLGKIENGYPNLAAFHSSDEDFAVYRRFGYLQARVLLDKQDQLRVLEEKLDEFDECDVNRHTNDLDADDWKPRKELLHEIETLFLSYANVFQCSQNLMASNRPSSRKVCSISNYLENVKPVHSDERTYIQHKEDLVTLRPGREHAFLDQCIESCLHVCQGRLPFVHWIFASKTTRMKANGEKQYYYTRERINAFASLVVALVIIALLIVPIYLLYSLVKNNGDADGVLNNRATATCIGILLAFTLLFSAVISLFTRAKRHEVLGAAAGYCAVLVVFLGNVPS